MKMLVKTLILVVAIVAVIVGGVSVYYLTLPRMSLMVHRDSKVTGCIKGVNETIILHVLNDGNVNIHINACAISTYDFHWDIVTYTFQSDIMIPVGVETAIVFPAGGGEVVVETISGPAGAVASGGLYAISDNPEPNPLVDEYLFFKSLKIYTRTGQIRYQGITIE